MRTIAASAIAAGAIAAAGCGRGAGGPAAPAPLPVPTHLAGLFAGDRALTFDASHGETVVDEDRAAFATTAALLRCALATTVVGEFHVARITCESEDAPDEGAGRGEDDGPTRVGGGPWMLIESDVEGRYVTDGVGLWRDDGTEPWPPALAELRALVRTPALIGGLPVPGRDDHPTEAEEARGDYHDVYRDRRGGTDGLCGADVSLGPGGAVLEWCVDSARGLYLVNRASEGSHGREDQARLRDE